MSAKFDNSAYTYSASISKAHRVERTRLIDLILSFILLAEQHEEAGKWSWRKIGRLFKTIILPFIVRLCLSPVTALQDKELKTSFLRTRIKEEL